MSAFQQRPAEAAIRDLYRRRDQAGKRLLYDPTRPEILAWTRRRAEAALAALTVAGLDERIGLATILDVGCGTGQWLGELVEWGADPVRMLGVELLEDRLREGRVSRPELRLVLASGWALPVRDSTFDLVSLFTVLSSLPDPESRLMLGREVRRVLRPGGHALVYDFRFRRPGSTDLVGIGPKEVMAALGGSLVWRRSLTLAPPLARRLARLGAGWVLAAERLLSIFRTHRMYLVRPY